MYPSHANRFVQVTEEKLKNKKVGGYLFLQTSGKTRKGKINLQISSIRLPMHDLYKLIHLLLDATGFFPV